MSNDKLSFWNIANNLAGWIDGKQYQNDRFGMEFPRRFKIQEDKDGEKIVYRVKENKVVSVVSDEVLADSILKGIYNLPHAEFQAYHMDHAKAVKIAKWMKATRPNWEVDIYTVCQQKTDHYCYHRFDFNYGPQETPTFDYVVSRLESNQEAFLAMIGSMFDHVITPQAYLWMYGVGGDGKGSICRFLKKLFDQAYIVIPTDMRDIDKHWSSTLVGKRIAVSPDTKNLNIVNNSKVMSVSGGDDVSVRNMYRNSFTTSLNTILVFGANAAPKVGSDYAARRRAVVCKFKEEGKEFIEGFEDKLWSERAGIVFKCYEAWVKVKKTGNYQIPTDQDVLTAIAADTEEFQEYLLESYFELDPNFKMQPTDLQRTLRLGEKKPLTTQEIGSFKLYLERQHKIARKKVNISADGEKAKYAWRYVGIRSKLEKDDSHEY